MCSNNDIAREAATNQPAVSATEASSEAGLSKRELQRNLEQTFELIRQAARESGRDPKEITLLPVTKFHPVEAIAQLAALGETDVAENREQEARDKAEKLPDVRFHMIGQVQTKKANSVARWAHSVHSLDSIKLADALERGISLAKEREQRPADFVLPVFLQLSVDGDSSRGGVQAQDLEELAAHVDKLTQLELAGIMVVPPLDADASEVFREARALCDALAARFGRALRLSAGMSADLDKAIAAGSDIVRVGTGIMGQRPVAF